MAEVSQNPSRTVLVAVDSSEYSLEAFECEYSKKSNVACACSYSIINVPPFTNSAVS